MTNSTPGDVTGQLDTLQRQLRAGIITRRHFIEGAAALGISIAGAAALGSSAAAQEASPTSATIAVAPAANTENQERGGGGELRLLQWQAPSQMSPHNSTGDKDVLASQPVLEPLMHYAPDSSLIANLVAEVPSLENGLLAADSTSVTFNLLPDVVWSDGTPFTANDVVFTWEWVTDPANAANTAEIWGDIASLEAVDDLTITATFANPTPLWFVPFTNNGVGAIYPQHILAEGSMDDFRLNPIGTGPYVVESFSVNDQVIYAMNETYREPNKPYFNRVILKGGGDAASAARAVIQTGDYDFAWYTQIEPEILQSMEADDSPGMFAIYDGAYAERLHLNMSDPNTEVDGQRSEVNTPNPTLGDPAVREAMALAIDRQLIADQLFFAEYGEGPSNSVISGNPLIVSENTSWEFNPEKAKEVLEAAGWTGDGTRSKDGVELRITYNTTINQVRQKIQAIVKKNLEDVGFSVELMQTDGSIYFDSAEGNDQNTGHMYYDMNMHQIGAGSPLPLNLMRRWYAGPDNENVAQASNGWSALNSQRYVNPDYDAILEAAETTLDPEELRGQLVEMNDIIINNHVVVPLVDAAEKYSHARWLNQENFGAGQFELLYWNIANWNGDRPS